MSTRSPRTLNRPRGIPSPRQRRISALARLRRNTARRRHRHVLRSPARHRQPQGDLQAEHAALPAIGHACGHNLTAAASLAALLGCAAALAASPRPAACGCSARRPKKAAAANSSWSPPARASRARGPARAWVRRGRGSGLDGPAQCPLRVAGDSPGLWRRGGRWLRQPHGWVCGVPRARERILRGGGCGEGLGGRGVEDVGGSELCTGRGGGV